MEVFLAVSLPCKRGAEYRGRRSELVDQWGEQGNHWNYLECYKQQQETCWGHVNEDMTRWKRGTWGQFPVWGNKSCFHVLATAYHLNTAYHGLDWFCLLPFSCPLSLPWAKTLGLSFATAEQDSPTPIENRFILGEDLASYLITEIGTRVIAFLKGPLITESEAARVTRAAENWCLRKVIWGFPGILFSAVFVPNEDSECSRESSSKACSGVSQQKDISWRKEKLQKTVKLLKKIEQSESPLKPTAFWCAAKTAVWNGAEIFPQQVSGQCKYKFQLRSTFCWRRTLHPVCSLLAVCAFPSPLHWSREQWSVTATTDTQHLHKPPGNMQHVFENQSGQEQQRRGRGQGKGSHSKEARLLWNNQQPELVMEKLE